MSSEEILKRHERGYVQEEESVFHMSNNGSVGTCWEGFYGGREIRSFTSQNYEISVFVLAEEGFR